MNNSRFMVRWFLSFGLVLALWSPLRLSAQSVMADVNGDGVPDEIYQAQTFEFNTSVGSSTGGGGCPQNLNTFWFWFNAYFPTNDYSPATRLNMNVYFGPQGYCPTTYVQMVVQLNAQPGYTYRIIADYNGGSPPPNLIGRSGSDYTVYRHRFLGHKIKVNQAANWVDG